jgi:hypothetical protein
MERLHGDSLARELRRDRLDPDVLIETVASCGLALAIVHRRWTTGTGPMVDDETIDDCRKHWPWRPSVEGHRVAFALRETLGGAGCRWSRLYMDFDPVNVLVGPRRPGLLDPPDTLVIGPIHWDLGVFCVGLERTRWRTLGPRGVRGTRLGDLRSAFLRGYASGSGMTLGPADHALIDFFEMLRLAQLWTWWSRPTRFRSLVKGTVRALYAYPKLIRARNERLRRLGGLATAA